MPETVDTAVSLVTRFLGSKDTRSLRIVFLCAVIVAGLWIAYVCDRFAPMLPGPWAKADDLASVKQQLALHSEQLNEILKLQLAGEIRIVSEILCGRLPVQLRYSEQLHLDDLELRYQRLNSGQQLSRPPCS